MIRIFVIKDIQFGCEFCWVPFGYRNIPKLGKAVGLGIVCITWFERAESQGEKDINE